MDYLVVDGVKPYDGRYEFGIDFTVREWGWIKRHSGYLPLTLFDGWKGQDPELMAVFALISLVRAGKVDREDVASVWERFEDAPEAKVRLELEARTDDESDPSESSSGNGSTSGAGSTQSSESLVVLPPATGTPGSATSESHPVTAWGN